MFRAIFELLVTVVVIYFLRAVMRTVFKGFGDMMNPNANPPAQSRAAARTYPLRLL